MYTDDDEQPHAKIDRVVNRHNDEKEKQGKKDESKRDDKRNETKKDESKPRKDDSSKDGAKTTQVKRDAAGGSSDKDKDSMKRQHSDEKTSKRKLFILLCKKPNNLLRLQSKFYKHEISWF